MSIPNCLTLARIFISPIFLLLYIAYPSLGISHTTIPYLLISLMTISELSDGFDGYFARKYNQVTDLGKILDPMADSISRISVMLTFTLSPVNLPMLLIFVFIYRDSAISTLRTICALKGFALAARPSGKLKAIIQAVAGFMILGLMIPHSLGYLSGDNLQFLATCIVSGAAVYTLISGVDYIYANRSYIARMLRNSGNSESKEDRNQNGSQESEVRSQDVLASSL